MDKLYEDFFQKLLLNIDRLPEYVTSLYEGREYSGDDLNQIFGVLMENGLLFCDYGDDRALVRDITFKGKHYFDPKEKEEEIGMGTEKCPLVFVSHSSENKEEVKSLVELLTSLGLKPKQDVFCSSIPGYDMPVGSNIYNFLRERFLNYEIHVLFVHSHEFYESPVCLNEMGAAWALKTKYTSFLLPGFDFADMKGVVDGSSIAIKLDNDPIEVRDKLNQVRRDLETEFKLSPIQDILWEQARDRFIDVVNSVNKREQEPSQDNNDILMLLKRASEAPGGQIMKPFDCDDGVSIQIGEEVVASEYTDHRNYAKWDEAMKRCIAQGYIKRKSDVIYAITESGYQLVDKAKTIQGQ